MAKVVIDKDKCKGCLLCVKFCPRGCLKKSGELNKRGVNFVKAHKQKECLGCLQCAIICPECCIEVYK